MILIRELNRDVDSVLVEGANGEKDLFLSGIFMQTEAQNKNGRIYPRGMMEQKVREYNEQFVKTSRALGELEHPATPQINLDRVSHLITELKFDGNDIYGKAKIMPTPCGNIARGLIQGGAQLGVSSRGVGSVVNRNGINEVQQDFRLVTVDLVANPSAHSALVQGIYENAEWVWNNGVWEESSVAAAKKEMDTKYSEARALELFEAFMRNIRA